MAGISAANILTAENSNLHHDENNLNISLESDHLDPDQKAAHEADTLPMDGPQPPQTKQHNKWSAMSDQCKTHLSPILLKV